MVSLKIWIIEEHIHCKSSLAELFSQHKEFLECRVAGSVEELLNEISQASEPGVILLDLELSGAAGMQLLSDLKKISPLSFVIILTLEAESDTIYEAINMGADGFLLKTDSPEDIFAAVNDVLAGGSPINVHVAKRILQKLAESKKSNNNYNLSVREKSILSMLVEGHSRKQIAGKLSLSYHTIDYHLRNIYKKLQVNCQNDAVVKSLKEGLV